ncbi:MAG: hypothetical protein ACXWU1_10445 [Allosphingosinicella sp.]
MATRLRQRPIPRRRPLGRARPPHAAASLPIGAELALAGDADGLVSIPRPLFDRLLSLARSADPGLEIAPLLPEPNAPRKGAGRAPDRGEDAAVRMAKCIYQMRRSRELHFHQELFSEPAWDLLLYLYVRTREGRTTCVSGACRGAAAPPTTALRWLARLEGDGLIERETDRKDGRRSHVRLSTAAMAAMQRLLRDLRLLIGSERPDA